MNYSVASALFLTLAGLHVITRAFFMNSLGIDIDNYIITPLFLLLLVGGLIGVVTFYFLLRYRNTPGVKYWLVWQVAASIWAFTYAFEYAATDIETKILWSKFSYFGIVYLPVSFMFFSFAFSSYHNLLKKKYIVFGYLLASLFIIPPFTNNFHHLHWRSYAVNPFTNATDYVYGPLFWVLVVYTYTQLMTGIVLIVRLFFGMSVYYKRQIALLFVAALLPLFGNLIYIFQVNPLPGFDWTPFTFLITGILIAINMSQFRMFDLVPFARNKLFSILPDAILIFDNRKRVADYNQAMKELIDTGGTGFVGKNIDEVFPRWEKMIKEVMESDDFQTIISHEVKGRMRYFDLQVLLLYDHRKQCSGRLVVLKDITPRIQAEEQITEAHIRLINEIQEKEQLIHDLDAFSHTVAHDLKGLLGAIVTASNLIQYSIDEMGKDELLEIVDLISQTATKTTQITSELLTLASVRQQEIKPVPVNMEEVAQESVARLKDMIHQKKAQIILPETWHNLLGNKAWLEEALTNYISNALKYGGNPPVIKIGSEILDKNRVKIWVHDNGKGLSREEMALLFNKFTRLDTLRIEGHGLGLSIVKRIVEKLNGEVGVESKNIPGEGSIFYFILPLATSAVD